MTFKTPSFWYQPWDKMPPLLRFFTPLGNLYGMAGVLRGKFITPVKMGIPVICVGNLVAGGSGKTPTALALLVLLKEAGMTKIPCFLTRGYGGNLTGPVFVSQHSYREVGDEALLLAKAAPTIVAKDRIAGAHLALASGHDLIIMDDGFQNPALYKDASLVVVDGRLGFGNGFLIPFGPLREAVSSGLTRARAVIKVGEGPSIHTGKPVIGAKFQVTSDIAAGKRVLGFCGLGQPEKFRQTLFESGFEIADFISFSDHHPYSHADIQALHVKAFEMKAHLVTTEKDLCRLPSTENISIIKIKLVFDDAPALLALLREPA